MAMSIFDFISQIGLSLTTLPTPMYDQYGNPWNVYGAHGNDTTCTIQGFVIQWAGMTSLFFNVSLSAYYMLVFVFSWKEKGRRKWLVLFLSPIVIGTALGLLGIGHYYTLFYACMIERTQDWIAKETTSLLFITPAVSSLAFASIFTFMVYIAIRRRTTKPPGMAMPHRAVSQVASDNAIHAKRIRKIEREVFWQSVFYLGALYLTWPLLVVGYLDPLSFGKNEFYFYLTLYTLIPAQGTMNSIVYFRPRFWRWAEMRRRNRLQKGQGTKGSGTRRFSLSIAAGADNSSQHPVGGAGGQDFSVSSRNNHNNVTTANNNDIDNNNNDNIGTSDLNPSRRSELSADMTRPSVESSPFLDQEIEPSALIAGNIAQEVQNLQDRLFSVDTSPALGRRINSLPPTIREESRLDISETGRMG